MLITGALLGAGGDIVGQMISNQSMDLSKIDWGSVALSGLAGGATGLFSATGAGPVAMGIMGGVTSGSTEIYHQMQSGEEINWGQVATRTIGGVVSGSVLGGVGSQTASGAKEIAKNAGKVFLANGTASLVENTAYNLQGGDDLVSSVKNASVSALISGTTSSGFYALGQVGRNMCFVEGTMVLTAAGLVVIESIAVGDMVIATDPETGETAEKEVKNTFVNETEELAHVFVDGEEIVCTPGHKFYAPEKGWTSAIKLRAGDKLQLVNGEYVTVENVQHELLEEPVKVYNFEVEDFHTYYVGTDVQVLVHNKKCGDTQASAAECNNRATEINNSRNGIDKDRGTTAVMKAIDNTTGEEVTLVSTNLDNKSIPKSLQGVLNDDEIYIGGVGHAEQTIMQNKGDRYTIIAGGTSRNICKDTCAPLLEADGLTLGGPKFNGRNDKTPFRQFWREENAKN